MIEINWHPGERQLKQFALFSLPGFGLFGAVAWHMTGSAVIAVFFLATGVCTCVLGIKSPHRVRPIYLALTAATFPIGWCVSAMILRLFFYAVLTPIGLISRLMGRDPLRLRRPESAQTYWKHAEQAQSIESYFRTY